jgi:ArsR family metal-binding transcriptional regulator
LAIVSSVLVYILIYISIYICLDSLDSLQTKQSLHVDESGKIVLGALAYPEANFVWKKNGTSIDFLDARLTLEKDGSISITRVQVSDAGSYDVNINWERRVVNDVTITVDVIGMYTELQELSLKFKFGVCFK